MGRTASGSHFIVDRGSGPAARLGGVINRGNWPTSLDYITRVMP